jgi:hypothetical protein
MRLLDEAPGVYRCSWRCRSIAAARTGPTISNANYWLSQSPITGSDRRADAWSPPGIEVVQASKIELVINSQTAGILRLTVPPSLLATADEMME